MTTQQPDPETPELTLTEVPVDLERQRRMGVLRATRSLAVQIINLMTEESLTYEDVDAKLDLRAGSTSRMMTSLINDGDVSLRDLSNLGELLGCNTIFALTSKRRNFIDDMFDMFSRDPNADGGLDDVTESEPKSDDLNMFIADKMNEFVREGRFPPYLGSPPVDGLTWFLNNVRVMIKPAVEIDSKGHMSLHWESDSNTVFRLSFNDLPQQFNCMVAALPEVATRMGASLDEVFKLLEEHNVPAPFVVKEVVVTEGD